MDFYLDFQLGFSPDFFAKRNPSKNFVPNIFSKDFFNKDFKILVKILAKNSGSKV